jgi:hypothetical protein
MGYNPKFVTEEQKWQQNWNKSKNSQGVLAKTFVFLLFYPKPKSLLIILHPLEKYRFFF